MNTWLAYCVTTLTAVVSGIAVWSSTPTASTGATELALAAEAFLGTLPPELRATAARAFDDAERTAWNFVPGRYAGVELGALEARPRASAHVVLQTMLSARGYTKTMAIVQLETVLHELESRPDRVAAHRDPGRYSLLICGEPVANGNFMVRFQGHHVSLQVVVKAGKIVGHTPHFLGSNPHEVATQVATQGATQGERRRVFGSEEDLARAFLLLLDDAQLARAVVNEPAPADVLLGPGKEPSALGARRGLPWSAMNEAQRGVLWRLLEEYAHVHCQDVAEAELMRIRTTDLDELSFLWAGGRERGQGHYYRIHGVHFAIEYDNTQDGANHVHTVWRDFERDFGRDPLREHLEHQHR